MDFETVKKLWSDFLKKGPITCKIKNELCLQAMADIFRLEIDRRMNDTLWGMSLTDFYNCSVRVMEDAVKKGILIDDNK
jgi:hypothetical protein